MVKKRGPGGPPKKRDRGRPKGSRNKIITGLQEAIMPAANRKWHVVDKDGKDASKQLLEYVKDYNEIPSFRSRLEAATVKFEQAVNETIEQLKGKV